ncbi:hypothetical protein J3F83DRAFT_729389 [Trichoderma novae-zelandiae]
MRATLASKPPSLPTKAKSSAQVGRRVTKKSRGKKSKPTHKLGIHPQCKNPDASRCISSRHPAPPKPLRARQLPNSSLRSGQQPSDKVGSGRLRPKPLPGSPSGPPWRPTSRPRWRLKLERCSYYVYWWYRHSTYSQRWGLAGMPYSLLLLYAMRRNPVRPWRAVGGGFSQMRASDELETTSFDSPICCFRSRLSDRSLFRLLSQWVAARFASASAFVVGALARSV